VKLVCKYFVSLLILAAICGCDSSSRKVKLRFWNGFTGPDGRTMLKLVRRFNQENPDIYVQMQRIDWATYYNKLFVAGIGNRAPDIFVIHTSSLMRFAKANFLMPLDDLVVGSNRLDVADFDSNIWASTKIDGLQFAIPLDIHPWGLYYNKKLFREAGIVDENGKAKPPTNMVEFIDVLTKLKKDKDGDGNIDEWGYVFTFFRANTYTFMKQWGGKFFSDDMKKCVLNNPENIKVLNFCADLINKKLVPEPENLDAWLGFRQGKVGMVIEGVYMLADLQKQKDLEFGAAPVPQLGPQKATWAGSHNLCLREELSPEKLAAAWKFVKFLSDNSLDWAVAGQIPVRKSLRDTDRFRSMETQYAFSKQIPYAKYSPIIRSIFELWYEYDFAVEKTMRGRCGAKEALDEAVKKYNKTLERQKNR